MSDPIPDKAQVSIDFPHKVYMGTFGRESRFNVTAGDGGVHVHIDRPGEQRRHVGFHLHYGALASVLRAMSDALGKADDLDRQHARALHAAATHLADQLSGMASGSKG